MKNKMTFYLAVGFVVLLASVFLIKTYYEMKTFNKFSDTKATYVDALVTQLRVIPDRKN